MSRFASASTKLGRFVQRNEGALLRGFVREAGAKAMRRPALRRLATWLTPVRTPERWLFVVGCYNSGTTILRRVLESHPQIAGLPHEGAQTTAAFPDLEAGGWVRMMHRNRDLWDLPDDGAEARLAQAMRDWSPFWPKGEVPVFLEKSIDHATRVAWLDRHLDDARFVAITRNGYCVCEGVRRRATPRDAAREAVGESYPMEMVAEQWVAFDERLRADIARVPRAASIRYEDLMAEPVATLERIFALAGVDAPAMRLDGDVLAVGEARHELIDQNPASLSRLSAEEIARATPIMREALLRNGYEPLGGSADV